MCQSVSHNKVIKKKWTKISIDQQKWYIHLYTSFIGKLIFKDLSYKKNGATMRRAMNDKKMTTNFQF